MKPRLNIYDLINAAAVFVLLIGLSSCYQQRVEVHHIPSNTPTDATIFITGDFNNWDPGDDRFIMEEMNDSTYFIDLPRAFGTLEYKFTRGDWTTVEKDDCGYEIDNRQVTFDKEEAIQVDTIRSWSDLDPVNCRRMTMILTRLPDNTPPGARISLTGNINNWESSDPAYLFQEDSLTGLMVLHLPTPAQQATLEYKITRGGIDRSEGDALGEEIRPHVVAWGKQDTLFVEVLSWVDLEKKAGQFITLIIEKLPATTPPGDPVYFVGEINDWFPYQGSLRLERNSRGQLFINLPSRALDSEYKFTRGGWGKVEVDKYGFDIDNRVLRKEKGDSPGDVIVVSIDNWADLSEEIRGYVTIAVTDLPASTPGDDDIYIAGNFNGWNPGSESWKLKKTADSSLSVLVPRENGSLEFKFTRGNWESVEADQMGEDINNRTYSYRDVDTLELIIQGWIDLSD